MTTMDNDQKRPYVLWRRVSTKQQGDSGLGLDAQLTIAEFFMQGEPAKIFTDVYSGTKLGECPDLKKAIGYCKKHGYLLVIAKTDRFRNVQQALGILDEMGEGNVCFCDLPTTDRTVLTIVFAIWERQALMGRINTKKALAERKRQGSWISNTGNRRTHLGREKGCDLSAANKASAVAREDRAMAWLKQSSARKFADRKKAEGWTYEQIANELGHLFDDEQAKINALPDREKYANPYGTPKGCKPSIGHISRWLRYASAV